MKNSNEANRQLSFQAVIYYAITNDKNGTSHLVLTGPGINDEKARLHGLVRAEATGRWPALTAPGSYPELEDAIVGLRERGYKLYLAPAELVPGNCLVPSRLYCLTDD